MSISTNSTYTAKQLKCLHAAARSAYSAAGGAAKLGAFDPWRREQIHQVTGNWGFSDCHQADFANLLGHFQHIAGNDAAAFRTLLKAGKRTEVDAAQTRWHLDQAVRRLGSFLTEDPQEMEAKGRAYCLVIARAQLGHDFTWHGLGEIDPDLLGKLVFTIRNRANALARKQAQTGGGDPF